MAFTLSQIAEALGAQVLGAAELRVVSVAEPADAGPDQLALAMKPEYAEDLSKGQARAAMLWDGADWQAMGLEGAIIVPRPRYAMAGVTRMLDPGQGWDSGIHPSAVIDPSAELGEGVSIGALCVIGAGVRIGEGSVIGPQCYIGTDVQVGQGTLLREGVKVSARVVIGDQVIVHPGAVIGSDGFSFVTPEVSAVEMARKTLGDHAGAKAQAYARIHSLGSVRIGDRVEVGANSTIDRGTVRDTVIGQGSKVDNLVQIGHNSVVGQDCLICGMAGLAGSVTLGNNVVLGGRAAVADNTRVGNNVVAAGGSKIISNVPEGRVVMGYPATKMDQQIELYKHQRRLGRLYKDVAELKQALHKKTVSKDT